MEVHKAWSRPPRVNDLIDSSMTAAVWPCVGQRLQCGRRRLMHATPDAQVMPLPSR
jgi:hypothetical protein